MEILVDKEVSLVKQLSIEQHAPSPQTRSSRTRKRISSHERQNTELPPDWTSEVSQIIYFCRVMFRLLDC